MPWELRLKHQGWTLGARVKGAKQSVGRLPGETCTRVMALVRNSSLEQTGKHHEHLHGPHPLVPPLVQPWKRGGGPEVSKTISPPSLVTLIGLTPLLF